MNEEKLKALNSTVAMIEKQYGKGAIMKLGDANVNTDLEVIPTGCLSLDLALGVGGVPRGRIMEIYGPESSGKTTVALHIIAEAQKRGGVAAFIDAEHALDAVYAKNLGVNTDELYISQPDTGEQALDICESLVRSRAVDVIVVDSVAALTPKAPKHDAVITVPKSAAIILLNIVSLLIKIYCLKIKGNKTGLLF